MSDVNVELKQKTARQLVTLAELSEQGQVSDALARTVDKLVNYEIDQCRTQLAQLAVDLSDLEARYGLKSSEFFTQYQAGQLDDRMDYVEWAALVQMNQKLEHRLQTLTNEEKS